MSHRRVLLTADAVGGVWRYAVDLAAGLAGFGWNTVLATLGPPVSEAQRAEAGAVPGLRLIETGAPLDWLGSEAEVRGAAARLSAFAAEEDVDLVHLNSPAFAGAASFAVPVIAAGHGCLASWWAETRNARIPETLAWHAQLTRAGLLAAARVVAPSDSFGRVLARVYDLPAAPLTIHNGATFPAVVPLAPAAHAFTAGRLWDEAKGAALLDEVAARLSVPLRAAGACVGPHGETVRPAHLHALGTLDGAGMAAELGQRPVFVSAARFEPFGLAVLEAAAAGCPLVLADTPIFRELWDGAAAFAPLGQADAFAAAIEALIGDPDRRRAAAHAARQRAARFAPGRTAQATAALYAELAAEAPPRRRSRAAA